MEVYSQILSLRSSNCMHQFYNVMFDGKNVSAILNVRSNSVSNACKLPPSKLNDLTLCKKTNGDVFSLLFGFSSLHARIRFLEYVLNVAAKMHLKIGRVTKKNHATVAPMIKEGKKNLQIKIKTSFGLIVNQPRSGGNGTSNTGNTSRRFFSNPALASRYTGFDENILSDFQVIFI
eukprot:Pompholyxophrys_punicea_v1_NODE_177_length_2995_cov_22.931633.p1 type:complete len:176 gc:universal NODE_177_length_2995_cov_22.931633:1259-1786(+)